MTFPIAFVSKLRTKRLILAISAFILVWTCTSLALLKTSRHRPHGTMSSPQIEETFPVATEPARKGSRVGKAKFALLVPANNPSPDLCKLATSAIALGYPSPILINWGKDFSKSGGGSWGSYLAKITGTLEYLDKVTNDDANEGDKLGNNDLVLMVDAYDVWFQLPPDTLLQRYHQSNHGANARLAEQWPYSSKIPMKQTIIAAAQKRCFPTIESGSNLYCDDLPESNLPADLYGDPTDTDSKKKYYHNVRPRYLNSGSFMGPVGDMRHYLRRVKQRMERVIVEDLGFEGDQGIFGEIFGEQELWRKWRREQAESSSSNATPSKRRGSALWQRDFEFHVGLDYSQQLFLPTVYAEHDGHFVSLSNRSFIQTQSSNMGIDPVRLDGVPDDIRRSTNALRKVLPPSVAKGFDWEQLPVYADFYTTAIPAVLHHNAWKNGVKKRRTEWWDRTWYFQHLRHILEQRLKSDKLNVLGKVSIQNTEITYYAPSSDRISKLPKIFDPNQLKKGFRAAPLDQVCRYPDAGTRSSKLAWYDEVFRDGGGPIVQ